VPLLVPKTVNARRCRDGCSLSSACGMHSATVLETKAFLLWREIATPSLHIWDPERCPDKAWV
jgi:hypothetical protein